MTRSISLCSALVAVAGLLATGGLGTPVALAAPPAPTPPAAPEGTADASAEAQAFTQSFDTGKTAALDPAARARGEALYRQHCATCHEGQVPKAPHRDFVMMLPGDALLASMTDGIMQAQSAALSPEEKRLVAEYLSGAPLGQRSAAAAPPRCEGAAARFDLARPPVIHGWGFDRGNTRSIPGEVARLPAADVPRLRVKWALAYPGAQRARSQPTFAMGALFVGSQDGTVYALDAKTGCVRWTFRTSAEVRTPIILSTWTPQEAVTARPRVFFGDLIGRVYALDALTGRELWRIRADDHPNATITGAPVYHEGTLFVPVSSLEVTSAADPKYECCTFRGSVIALDPETGAMRWRAFAIDEEPRPVGVTKSGTRILAPSGAPIWNAPTIDAANDRFFVGTGENYSSPANDRSDAILMFDRATGRLRASRQIFAGDAWNVGCMIGNDNCPVERGPDYDLAAGTVLARGADGRARLLVGLKTGAVMAFDPDRLATPLWETRVGRGGIQGGVHFGLATAEGRVYVPIADMKDERDGKVQTEPAKPGLYAVDLASGRLLWSSPADDVCAGRDFCDPGISAAITAIPGVVFAGHMDGRLRAYDAASGRVVWQYDATQEIATLNGRGRGGSMGGGGPVVHDGMVYVNSGYGLYFHMPGNLLLAFAAE
jgi:polyvinyl alcohol dehydrogenase (cytochrome)